MMWYCMSILTSFMNQDENMSSLVIDLRLGGRSLKIKINLDLQKKKNTMVQVKVARIYETKPQLK